MVHTECRFSSVKLGENNFRFLIKKNKLKKNTLRLLVFKQIKEMS